MLPSYCCSSRNPGVSRSLRTASWNLAAINNNPFEYWITHDDPAYLKLMRDVEVSCLFVAVCHCETEPLLLPQAFIEAPGERDVTVESVFTAPMFEELKALMSAEGWDVEAVTAQWEAEYKDRRIISGFLKDKTIGAKRLASMPDRVTNTINCLVDGAPGMACRPCPTSMFDGDLSTSSKWWEQWKEFMFRAEIEQNAKGGGTKRSRVCSLLGPIKHSKYPAISLEEEAISIPLQMLCQAIFDAVQVHILNTVAPGVWFGIHSELCDKLGRRKMPLTLAILESRYADRDVVFLQEVAAIFVDMLEGSQAITAGYHVVKPAKMDAKRDQNSVVPLNKAMFAVDTVAEVTEEVVAALTAKDMVMDGDILGLKVEDNDGGSYFMASFHGDTNGLATIPTVEALQAVAKGPGYEDHHVLWGLDANAHFTADGGKRLGVEDWQAKLHELGLSSGSGMDLPEEGCYTCYNARTYLQAQLNKACKSNEIRATGDVNPKDFIVFQPERYELGQVKKDNTGEERFIPDTAFPTLTFPSDHAVLACDLVPKGSGEKGPAL